DNCGASGYYQAPSQGGQLCCIEAFVDSQANGTWGAGRRAPGTDEATITSLSCPSSGNCSTVGYAVDAPVQAYILTERRRTWARAKEVPGITALSQGGRSRLSSMSCTSAGNCSAGG